VPQQRPMDADRRRRRHRRRCLTSCCPPPGRPRPGVPSVQQLAETAACCNDRRLTCSYSARQQTSLVQQPRLLSRSTDRLAVSEAPFVGHVVDCHTLEMTQKGEKVRMRYLYVLHFPVLHFPALQNGPPFFGPAFSEILFLQIRVLLFPVLHFQHPLANSWMLNYVTISNKFREPRSLFVVMSAISKFKQCS